MLSRSGTRIPYLLFILLLLGCGPAPPNAKTIEQDIAKAVPLHSSVGQVLDYLNAQKIEHSEYLRDAFRGNSIHAVLRDHSRWAIVKTDVGIVFKFDEHDRLAAYDVAEHDTGP